MRRRERFGEPDLGVTLLARFTADRGLLR